MTPGSSIKSVTARDSRCCTERPISHCYLVTALRLHGSLLVIVQGLNGRLHSVIDI
ncbi:hypothetical protein J6590_073677 [Homalodisca vitripennis]|nr:hypothetical protein J6590_073677 [Homalodisca vitripennis]